MSERNGYCNHQWRAPRGDVPFISADVNHFCALWAEHRESHWCACGAFRASSPDEAMTCDARTRPFIPVNDTEVVCELVNDHPGLHQGTIRDYAYPGSATITKWEEQDRRTFHGEWPGLCPDNCTLPIGHRGNHAP